MALSTCRPWASAACRLRLRAAAVFLCASNALLAAGCGDSLGPRPRPTGERPDTTSTQLANLAWYAQEPRVVIPGTTDSVQFTVAVTGTPAAALLQLRTGKLIPLQAAGDGMYRARADVTDLLFGYRSGDLHTAAGFIDITSASAINEQTTVWLNVKDNTVSDIATPQRPSANIQIASHVVNIRYDSLYLGGQVPAHVLRTFYDFFGDDYDFISVLEQVHTPADYHYFAVRNTISGLGLQTFDRAQPYGSPARLDGILDFPIDAAFDPAETGVIHELAHRWMNFSNLPILRDARPHFPISTLAFGITGRHDPDTGERAIFPFELTARPDGAYNVARVADQPRTFNDLELYLLGLLPADSVGPHVVFENQNQANELRNNGVLAGPASTFTVAQWIAREGPRTPSYSQAQRDFRMATIVLSRGGLLTREELAFFNHMAARAEAMTELTYVIATTRGTTLPFYLATGRRATLSTQLLR